MKSFSFILSVCVWILLSSCRQNDNMNPPAPQTSNAGSVQKGVRQMAADIAHDISVAGPVAWLNYFEQNPNFFMANEGLRVFPNNDSATHFVKDILAKNIVKVNLTWSNIFVDSLSSKLAVLSANYHEDLIDKDNQTIPQDGYFTALAEQTSNGWMLRDLHWSSLKK